jgi:nifR3 family TIM-barrel protein
MDKNHHLELFPMKIGRYILKAPTILAPLAGITHLPFRLMIKAAGCGLVCSEMVSANGLVHRSKKTRQLMDSAPEEKPLSIQIFGSEPDMMAEAARMVEAAGADILDINFGCSVKKILKSGSGSALMKEPERSKNILEAVCRAVAIPVTIKVRSGWDASGTQALRLARIAQDTGVAAVAVHPRTATQGFSGTADWTIIKMVKEALAIPVIGNGDITRAEDALAMFKETGCDAVMIGRAALHNPWIFSQAADLMAGTSPEPVTDAMRFDAMAHYARAAVAYFGETHACRMMRSRLGWLVKGLPGSSRFREAVSRVSSETEALDLIRSYRERLLEPGDPPLP